MKLSANEQRLLNFAREEFGERLTDFLLSGMGEDAVAQSWLFTITYAGDNSLLKRRVEVITYEPEDGSSYLPRGRHPMVLLAILRLMYGRDNEPPNSLRYKQEDILSLLGRTDTRKARKEIDEAVKRYFLLVYKWTMSKEELAGNSLSYYTSQESLLSEHMIVDEGAGESNRLVFNANFTERLLRRSLFGIDWNNVRSILRQSPFKK